MSQMQMPPQPRAMHEWLTENTGVEPETAFKKGRNPRIVLEHKNERVRMTITYSFGVLQGSPTWYKTGSTLEIGGEPVNLAEDGEEYLKVFRGEADPTGPAWESGEYAVRRTPRHAGHMMLNAVKAGPARSRRR